jgi:hypothetical protein
MPKSLTHPKSLHAPNANGVPTSSATVTLLKDKIAHAAPSLSSKIVAPVLDKRPLTAETTVLPVIGSKRTAGTLWMHVELPQRPDGITGWITSAGTKSGHEPWYIVVSLATKTASIYKRGKMVKHFFVVIGEPSTPTPTGHFFVAEILNLGYGIVTGPYALATSAYSNVYQEFEGGPGQVALHGLVGLYAPLGTAGSHGCVRFSDTDITWLATKVRPGTPIHIV